MSRSERFTEFSEIKRILAESSDSIGSSGPVLYYKNGRRFVYTGQSHINVIGKTGCGKSANSVLPMVRESFATGESLILTDPKKEIYAQTACFIPEDYQVYVVDFSNPRHSPTCWNPLSMPYRLYKSSNPDDNDLACSQISEFWTGVYPWDGKSDRFWVDSSANYAKGCTYALFDLADEENITIDSVSRMMEDSEVKQGVATLMKLLYDKLPVDSLAKRNLSGYATAPNDTRASIHSVATTGIEVFSRSRGLMEMMGEDTLNILDLDVNKPFILYIIIPDETEVYDCLAGLLVTQISQHLISKARELGGTLPIRVNIILEELGSLGKSIPSLPNLMVAGRSRNIRIVLVLQAEEQLVDIYGESKAETIKSCIGITIGFATNNWKTLNNWSERCGEKNIVVDGSVTKTRLITPAQLAAMPVGTALILVDNRYKFISSFPMYDGMYDNSGKHLVELPVDHNKSIKQFSLKELVAILNQGTTTNLGRNPFEGPGSLFSVPTTPTTTVPAANSGRNKPSEPIDIDAMLAEIDKKIAELEAQEKAEKSGKKNPADEDDDSED